jgi:integrase
VPGKSCTSGCEAQDEEKFEAVFLTRQELERFLDTAQSVCPNTYPLLLVFVRTGLRLGEALALRWVTRANMRDSIVGEDAVRALGPARGQKGLESHHNYNEMPPD